MTEKKNSKSFDMEKSDTKNFSEDLKNKTLLNTFLQRKPSLKKYIPKNVLPNKAEIKTSTSDVEKKNSGENFEGIKKPFRSDPTMKNLLNIEDKNDGLSTDLEKNNILDYHDKNNNSSSTDLKKMDSFNDNLDLDKFSTEFKNQKKFSCGNLKKTDSSSAILEKQNSSNADFENEKFFGRDFEKKNASINDMEKKNLPSVHMEKKNSSISDIKMKNFSSENMVKNDSFNRNVEKKNSISAIFQNMENSSGNVEKKDFSSDGKENQSFTRGEEKKRDFSCGSINKEDSMGEKLEKRNDSSSAIERKKSFHNDTDKKNASSGEPHEKDASNDNIAIKDSLNNRLKNNNSSSASIEKKNSFLNEMQKKSLSCGNIEKIKLIEDVLKTKDILDNAFKKSLSTGSNSSLHHTDANSTIYDTVSKLDDEVNDPENNIKKILKIQGFLEILEVMDSNGEKKPQLPSSARFPQIKSNEFLEKLTTKNSKPATSDKHQTANQEPILNSLKKPTGSHETFNADAKRLPSSPTRFSLSGKEKQQHRVSFVPKAMADKIRSHETGNTVKGKERVPFLQKKTQPSKFRASKYSLVALTQKENANPNGLNLAQKALQRPTRTPPSLSENNSQSSVVGESQKKDNNVEEKGISKNIEAEKTNKPVGNMLKAETGGPAATNSLRGEAVKHQPVQDKAKTVLVPSDKFKTTVNRRSTDKTKPENVFSTNEPVKRLVSRKMKPTIDNTQNFNDDTNLYKNTKASVSSLQSGRIDNNQNSMPQPKLVSLNLDKNKKDGKLKVMSTNSLKFKSGKEENQKKNQANEMMLSKLLKESQSNKSEDFVKINPEEKKTSIEVSKVVPEIDEGCGIIENIQVKESAKNENTGFRTKQSVECVLPKRDLDGSENQNTTAKHDPIKGTDLKAIHPVELGEVISGNSQPGTNVFSSLKFIRKMNSAPISKVFDTFSNSFKEQLIRKYSEPSHNLMWLPSSEKDSTEVQTVSKNLINNDALNTTIPHPPVKDSVMYESATMKNFIRQKSNDLLEENKVMSSDLLTKKEKISANQKPFKEVSKQSLKVVNFPLVKNANLKKTESIKLTKRSMPFQHNISYDTSMKRIGQSEKLSGSKNFETASTPVLDSKDKSSKQSVNERIELTKSKISNYMGRKVDTSNFSNKKPTLKKIASPLEIVTRPGHTSETFTTKRIEAIRARKTENSFNILPEKTYRNKYLNKFYSQQDNIHRPPDNTHKNSVKSSTGIDMGPKMPKSLKHQKDDNANAQTKQDIPQTTVSTTEEKPTLPLAKRAVSLQDTQKLEIVPLRKCRSLELQENINLLHNGPRVNDISEDLVNSNKNSSPFNSEVITKENITTTQQDSETQKDGPPEVVPIVESAKHSSQKKQATNIQADNNLSTSIKDSSLVENKIKPHKRKGNTTYQENNSLAENKALKEKRPGVKKPKSKMQKDATLGKGSTLLGTTIGRKNIKSLDKKDNKFSERKDTKMSEKKDTKLTEKKDNKKKVSTSPKAVALKSKTPGKLVEKGVTQGTQPSPKYDSKITKNTVPETTTNTNDISKNIDIPFDREKGMSKRQKKKQTDSSQSNIKTTNDLKEDGQEEAEVDLTNRRKSIKELDTPHASKFFSVENFDMNDIDDDKKDKKRAKSNGTLLHTLESIKNMAKSNTKEKAKNTPKQELENEDKKPKESKATKVVTNLDASKEMRKEAKETEGREKNVAAKGKSSPNNIVKEEKQKNSESGKKMNVDLKNKRGEGVSKNSATNRKVTRESRGKIETETNGKANLIRKPTSITTLGLRFQNKKDPSEKLVTKKLLNNSSGILGNQNPSKNLKKKSSLVLFSRMDSQHRKSSATLSNPPLPNRKTSLPVFKSGSRNLFGTRHSNGKNSDNTFYEKKMKVSGQKIKNSLSVNRIRNDLTRPNNSIINKKDFKNNLPDYLNFKKEQNPHRQTADETHEGLDGVKSESIIGMSGHEFKTKQFQNANTLDQDDHSMHMSEKKTDPGTQASNTEVKTLTESGTLKGEPHKSETNDNEKPGLKKNITPTIHATNKKDDKAYCMYFSDHLVDPNDGDFTILKSSPSSLEKEPTSLAAFYEMQKDMRLPISTFPVTRDSLKNLVDADFRDLKMKKLTSGALQKHMKKAMERQKENQRCIDFFPTHMVNDFATKCVNLCSWPIQIPCGQLVNPATTLHGNASKPVLAKTLNEWQYPYKSFNIDPPIKNFKDQKISDPYVMFAADTPLHVTAHYSNDNMCLPK